ncbi:cation:proton antiporter [Nodosilinea sp. FACHB-13]|uniref:cation:proton antiporter n=1 Tax=Cyanophyceae TaxID=3028117 RepID=UPI0016835034|nr:cation:proton antiporter [Nodosilinea sp. FACHB-13]MBD2107553.1 cation:proton antiporter [Nodosilinea sp. FACHB-13]
MSPTEIVIHVLVAILVVIGLSRLVGYGFNQIKQPLVIGEIVAGIMLGPSLLGWLAPTWQATLFPAEIMPSLNVLSQVGLIFFMFLIGLELNPKYLKGNLDVAILISHVSILAPFSMGSILALLLYPLVSNGAVSFTAFALFLGAAMAITAFPVLARIITENNLQKSRLGTLALTCAAVDDVTAWCVLALAITVTRTNSMVGALPTIIFSLIYIGLMVTVGQRFFRNLGKFYERTGKLSQLLVAGIYMAVIASALITETIGIHFIFGAFLLGAVMPKNVGLTRELAEKTEDFVLIFLLPVFFAYSGLKTQVGLLNSPGKWLLCLAVIGVAIVGKYVGTYMAARFSGIDHRESSALGWLMNTRGLTELIVLNIGLELGVVTPLLFTMLVIMALVTTFMTSPLLELIYPKRLMRLDALETEVGADEDGEQETAPYRVLVPVANPKSQKGLLRLAVQLAGNQPSARVDLLNLVEMQEDFAFSTTPTEIDRLIEQRQQSLNQLIESLGVAASKQTIFPIVRVTNDVARETSDIAQLEHTNLIVMGWHRPVFDQNRLGGRVGQVLGAVPKDVAVFVGRNLTSIDTVLVPYMASPHNDLALELGLRLVANIPTCRLKILQLMIDDYNEHTLSNEFSTVIARMNEVMGDRIETLVQSTREPIPAIVEASRSADLTIAGASREWGVERQTLGRYADALSNHCHSSLLITRKYRQVASPHLASVLSGSANASPS